MRIADARGVLEMIDRDECLRLLAGEEVGRLGVVDGRAALVLPVNYVLDGEAIVFRTAAGRKLEGALRAPVAFEVDHLDRHTRTGWSVVARGLACRITEFDHPDVLERLWALPLDPWVSGERPELVRIVPRSITGRRLRSSTGSAAVP